MNQADGLSLGSSIERSGILSTLRMDVVFDDPNIDEQMSGDFSSKSSFSLYLSVEGLEEPIWISLKYSRMEQGTASPYFGHDLFQIVAVLDELKGELGEGEKTLRTTLRESSTPEAFFATIQVLQPQVYEILMEIIKTITEGIAWKRKGAQVQDELPAEPNQLQASDN